jgi:hypothetical protein
VEQSEEASSMTHRRGPERTSLNIILSIVATAIAFVSLLFSMNTYWAGQRPYIGITDVEYVFNDSPKPALHWTLIVKNVGALPGEAVVDTRAATVAMGTPREPPNIRDKSHSGHGIRM